VTISPAIASILATALQPPPLLSMWEWADQHRMLSPAVTSEPGLWRTSRVPYTRAIADALSPSSRWRRIVWAKGSQVAAPLALDTPIATPEGWTTVGAVNSGDWVFGPDGKPYEVTGVSPVFVGRDCYRIRFSDGECMVADAQHRWTVDDQTKSTVRRRTLTTEQIAGTYHKMVAGRARNRYAIPCVAPLELPDVALPIAPYALGAWLANGNASSAALTTHEDDAPIVANLLSDAGHCTAVSPRPRWAKGRVAYLTIEPSCRTDSARCVRGHDLSALGRTKQGDCAECGRQFSRRYANAKAGRAPVEIDPVVNQRSGFYTRLATANLLNAKHVPAVYMRASAAQRWELLRGLMDGDGSASTSGHCAYTTISEKLRDAVVELLRSLGLKPVVTRHGPTGKGKVAFYKISFRAYLDQPVFGLWRKQGRLRQREGGRASETTRRRIVAVVRVASVPTRCLSVPDAPGNLFCAGAGMIATHNTELGLNFIGYSMAGNPGPILGIWPTTELAERTSRSRIADMIRESPTLKAVVKDPRSRDSGNTLLSKEFAGGVFVATGANSATGLRSTPARDLYGDELDAWEVTKEGDPLDLARRAVRNFPDRKEYYSSTPNLEAGSLIWAELNSCHVRCEYHVPCPFCAALQPIEWAHMHWTETPGETEGEAPRVTDVYLECRHCQGRMRNHHKDQMLPDAHMGGTAQWVELWNKLTPETEDASIGFHLSALYSPHGWFSWTQAAQQFVNARHSKSTEKMQVVWNTILGLPWSEPSEAPDWKALESRRENYEEGIVPRGVYFLTAGADVQQDRIEAAVWGWGPGKESWLVGYYVFPGSTAHLESEPWHALEALRTSVFAGVDGDRFPVWCLSVDSGAYTQVVYDWCRRRPQALYSPNVGAAVKQPGAVCAVKGVDEWGNIMHTPRREGASAKRGHRVWNVGTLIAKHDLYRRLRLEVPAAGQPYPPGFVHFPQGRPTEFFKQLVGEKMVTKTVAGKARRSFLKVHAQVEALDTAIYARHAAAVVGMDRAGPTWWTRRKPRGLTSVEAAPVTGILADAAGTAAPISVESVPERPQHATVPPVEPSPAPRRRRSTSSQWMGRFR
jgi:phage terminase large subunit GpA-like protein